MVSTSLQGANFSSDIVQGINMSSIARKLQIHDNEDMGMQGNKNLKGTMQHEKDKVIQTRHGVKEAKSKIVDSDELQRTEETVRQLKAALVEHMTKTSFSEKERDIICRAMTERKMVFKECKDIRNKLIQDLTNHSPGYVFKFVPAKQQWLQEIRLHERLRKRLLPMFMLDADLNSARHRT
jgi:hypothetical protein